MNYRRITAAVTALAAVLSAASCSSVKEKKKVSTPEPEPVTIAAGSVEFEWQDAYSSILSGAESSEDARFDLIDLNADGTPELILSLNSDESATCTIYTFADGAAVTLGEAGSSGRVEYIPQKNLIHSLYVGDSFEIGEYFEITDSMLVSDIKFFSSYGMDNGGSLILEINDEPAERDDFDEQVAAYASEDSIEAGRRYSLTASAVDYALKYSEGWTAVLTASQKQLYSEKLADYLEIDYANAAFDLCDFNGDNIPELIVSTGTYDADICRVFTITDDNGHEMLSEVTGDFGGYGMISYDIDNKLPFAENAEGVYSFDLTGADLGSYSPSGSTMVCGRRFFLSTENIASVLG